MKKEVRVGTCGFGRAKKKDFAAVLDCVEIQHTFYRPPQLTTLQRWRAEMADEFEFTLKAWQFITHEGSSPTYRRLKRPLTKIEFSDAGAFRQSETVKSAWATTLDAATALRARTVLFQCPAKFRPTDENISNLRTFFGTVERRGLNFAWEPRGDWPPNLIESLCEDLNLWHCVDPFKARTVTPKRCYFRLHGIGGWRYKYEDGELDELTDLLAQSKLSYVFFNNNEMFDDAQRFKRLL